MNNNQNQVIVRALQKDDYEQWLQLWLAYLDFYESKLDEDVTLSTFRRFLDADEPVFSAVAVQGDQLLGLVHCVLHRSTWSLVDYCYLSDLYVSPAVRGAGTGKALIAWAQDFARQRQCTRVYWHTHQSNERAQRLYNQVAQNGGYIEYRIVL